MSRQYKDSESVPSVELCARLQEISSSIAKGNYSDLTMRIPAEVDRDADIVISEAGMRIKRLEAALEALEGDSE